MPSVKLLEDIFWVGAIDWNIRNFHVITHTTHRGTTYNAYLINDEKIALVDTVHASFAEEIINKIKEVIDPSKIDYIIANHVEPDHSGSIKRILELAPNAKVVGTAACKDGLQKYYFGDWDFQIVKTGDEISIGKRTLKFIEAPMLHWPDSMFTYIEEDALLLPNDAFGQHWASSKRFDDEVDNNILMDQAAKYYSNIVWPYSNQVLKKIEEVQTLGLKIGMIAPSHGIIWRSNPTKILEAYLRWAKGETVDKILVIYDTMWGSTEKMAKAIIEGISSKGIETMAFRLSFSDLGNIIKELLEAKGLLIGSSTINNGFLPTVALFLEELQGLRPKNKYVATFGSYGWGGGAVQAIEAKLKSIGLETILPSLTFRWVPTNDEVQKCFDYGKEFAKKLKSG
jgi:anaerobic nitric oxide reductase flavorubredoxin